MALRSKWTVRVDSLTTALRVGIYAHEQQPQPIVLSLQISGLAETVPTQLDQCFDYEPICRWALDEWPKSAHTPLLETRLNELAEQIFIRDKRVMDVWVGIYKTQAFPEALRVGLERDISRRQYEELHHARLLPLTASTLLANKSKPIAKRLAKPRAHRSAAAPTLNK